MSTRGISGCKEPPRTDVRGGLLAKRLSLARSTWIGERGWEGSLPEADSAPTASRDDAGEGHQCNRARSRDDLPAVGAIAEVRAGSDAVVVGHL